MSLIKGSFHHVPIAEVPNNWTPYTIDLQSIFSIGGRSHKFDVQTQIFNGKRFVRPVKPYMVAEFEELFGLGLACKGFSTDICVDVTLLNLQ